MIAFLINLKPAELITLIGIAFTLFVGLINILISTHKSQLDGITQNRVAWMQRLREEIAFITSWRSGYLGKDKLNEEIYALRKSVRYIILHLNIGNELDINIAKLCNTILDNTTELLHHRKDFISGKITVESAKLVENYENARRELFYLSRIYLKKEWTRVKAESAVFRVPGRYYWIPFYGFCEKWAVHSIRNKYKRNKDSNLSWLSSDGDPIMIVKQTPPN